jgi:hypothetical protein
MYSIESQQQFEKKCRLFQAVSCLTYFSTVKIDAINSFKMLVGFKWIMEHYIPEGRTLHV